jgi:glycosyltransferase involved in cell wall biosynthesis
MNQPILYDMTQFMDSQVRSGVQRVLWQIACHWPVAGQLVPVRIDADGQLFVLPARVFDLMATYLGARPGNPDRAGDQLWRLAHLGKRLRPGDLPHYGAILNPELFFQPSRIRFYEELLRTWDPMRIFFIVYDFLPWLYPEWFNHTGFRHTLDYLRLLRQVRQVAFISSQTRDDYLHRFIRADRTVGPVLSLGADGLGMAAPSFDSSRRGFTLVGTIEPRKNYVSVLDAFERLWAEGVEVELTFIGRLAWAEQEGSARLEKAKQQPRFRWLTSASDDELVRIVRQSRATIYPSQGEGFGLPPLESLALGVPVIVTANLPSVGMIDPFGQVRLDVPDAESIHRAVLSLLDDRVASRLTDEIERLRLPTWKGLAEQLARWVHGNRGSAAA